MTCSLKLRSLGLNDARACPATRRGPDAETQLNQPIISLLELEGPDGICLPSALDHQASVVDP